MRLLENLNYVCDCICVMLYFYWTVLQGTSSRNPWKSGEIMNKSEGKKIDWFLFCQNAGFEDNTLLFGRLKFLTTSPTTAEAKTVSFLLLEIHKVCLQYAHKKVCPLESP